MPLPKPNDGEGHDEFIDRCMSNDTMNKEYPDNEQRYAICESQWQDKDKKSIRHYPNILSGMYGTIWAIMPEKLQAMFDFVDLKASGLSISSEQIAARTAAPRKAQKTHKTAILPLFGIISQKMNLLTAFSGGTSTDMFGASLDEALADDSVKTVVIDVDSPGGSVYGIHELTEKIFNARGRKNIIASVNSLCASAAYWIASAADRIYMTPSGDVGSIGVVAIHTDLSEAEKKAGVKTTFVTAGKYKTEGNELEPLNDEARATFQARVDDYYEMMVADIARNRGISAATVKQSYGEGRMYGAKQALKSKMVDRIASLEQVLYRFRPANQKRIAAIAEWQEKIKAES